MAIKKTKDMAVTKKKAGKKPAASKAAAKKSTPKKKSAKKAASKAASPKVTGAFGKIIERLASDKLEDRMAAIGELRATQDPAAVGGLMEGLRDANEEVVREAMAGLSDLGEVCIPPLISALKHKSWSVRRNSAKVLVRLGQASLDAIVAAMYSDDEDVQFWASEVLTEFGEEGLDRFLEILEKGSPANRACAISALGKIGSARAVPALVEQLGDSSWSIRRAASDALWEIGSAAVPALRKALDHQSTDVQFWAIQALGEIADPSAVPALVKKVKKTDGEEDRINIIKALGEIADPKAAAVLIEELGHKSWFVRRAAGEALWTVGPSAVDKLIKALKHKNVDVRYWACKVLGEMQAGEAVIPIVALLEDKEWSIRSGAAYALGEIGDEAAGEALLENLEDPNEIVRKNVVIALGQIGDAKAIRSSSESALGDQSEWVRRYAAKSLEKIKEKGDEEVATDCSACGHLIEEAWKFCPGCGLDLSDS